MRQRKPALEHCAVLFVVRLYVNSEHSDANALQQASHIVVQTMEQTAITSRHYINR